LEYFLDIGRSVMFQSDELKNHLATSHTIENEHAVYVEWNLNQPENIERLGNYRLRNIDRSVYSTYLNVPSSYDPVDSGGYYTGATDSDIVVDNGYADDNTPDFLVSPKKKMNLLYSLEDCIKQYRPRSGINKMLYLGTAGASYGYNQYIDDLTRYVARRPRYYVSSKYDQFKYWTSYRTESFDNTNYEYGISKSAANGTYSIDDAVPFVVYKEKIPTNKIVIKMQTNVGEQNLGPFRFGNEMVDDPLYGDANKTVPRKWRIEALYDSQWVTIRSFEENETRKDGTAIIKADGYVEISYGLNIPDEYADTFTFAEVITSASLLPDAAPVGYAYLVRENVGEIGTMYVYTGSEWASFIPDYDWDISEEDITRNSKILKTPVNPEYFISEGETVYREFQFIRGIRLVVETMNVPNATFDLIEVSPRLVYDISDKVLSFSITKTLSDLGNNSIPVGNLIASVGDISIYDNDFSLNSNNVFDEETMTGSILAKYSDITSKFNFYDIIKNIGSYDYYIPIKTMYSQGFPQVSDTTGTISMSLRDFYFFLEYAKAPQMLLTDVSLSYAITVLLDNIGFSNYTFKRVEGESELIIPFFFVGPDQNVAEVLQQLAVSSQSGMFFDEYNNFVVMSKNYILPTSDQRSTDLVLYGNDQDGNLPNIINLSSKDKKVYNGGNINYTTRYIQRSIGSTVQAPYVNTDYQTYIYKPSLLWEVAAQDKTTSQNEIVSQQTGYSLAAAPLNSDLTSDVPYVINNTIKNNVIDLGENVLWMTNFAGYLYANGEIIRYDAVEYSVQGVGNVWISNNHEYQDYFGNLEFNGKMYPTGNVRIYAEPQYEYNGDILQMANGEIKSHGRGQFGTQITSHSAGLTNDNYWTNDEYVRGCIQNTKDYMFNGKSKTVYPSNMTATTAGKTKYIDPTLYFDADAQAKNTTRNGIIKNFMTNKDLTEKNANYLKTTVAGSVQSSALIMNGPTLDLRVRPADFVSYVYKELPEQFKHFGTRMRVIGKVESGTNKTQTPSGAVTIYGDNSITSSDPSKDVSILGGSGGLGFNINKDTNNGYFFEIVALTTDNVSLYNTNNNVSSYTIQKYPEGAIVTIVNDLVTITTTTQHDFNVGDLVTVSGLIDYNDTANTDFKANGEFTVTAIGEDRKTLQYQISPATGINTQCRNGGTISKDLTQDSSFSNIFFYKVMAGPNQSEIIKKSLTSNVATLTASRPHSFVVGDQVIITGVDSTFNGTFAITAVSEDATTFSYNKTASNVTEADVSPIGLAKGVESIAIPQVLWSGLSSINVDDGKFTGQTKLTTSDLLTVYDLSVEYINIGSKRRFYLYINGKQIATVDDDEPLNEYKNMALFVRGSSRCMFENIYALTNNYSQNTSTSLQLPVSKAFVDSDISTSDALYKYAINGFIQNTFLSTVGSEGPPEHKIYYEEFGTIMRECAHFNIRYDRAYPALYAKLAPVVNRSRGYSVSGFQSGAYGADFLIFNCIDKNIQLDDTSGNYLKILGIAFTQSTTYSLTVDDYFKKVGNLADPPLQGDTLLYNPLINKQIYDEIKNSRLKYGLNEFSLESPYVQTTSAAEEMMGWIINKVMNPRKTIGINTFATSNIQLGDIVTIDYKNNEGLDVISDTATRYVVYNIDYKKESPNLTTTLYLAEV
jgi:hypothetical protein